MFLEDLNNNNKIFSKMAGDGDSTRSIVADYIRYRLEGQNILNWENGQGGNTTPTKVQLAMRHLGDEFEERFRVRFDGMIEQLQITPNDAQETFNSIVHEIFEDGVNWGRVVALFGFAARFSGLCVQNGMEETVDNVVDWVSTYVDNNLHEWMTSNEGWKGFLQFHAGPDAKGEGTWPDLRTIGGYALAGIGVITLGAFLTQRS